MIKEICDINLYPMVGLAKNERAYNGSIIRWQGKILCAFRIQEIGRSAFDYSGRSRICLTTLNESYQPVTGSLIELVLDPQTSSMTSDTEYIYEDPRLFIYNDRLWIAYTVFDHKTTYAMGCAELDENFSSIKSHFFPYGNNARNIALLTANTDHNYSVKKKEVLWFEKNWQFFEYDTKLHAVYSIDPHKVIALDIQTPIRNSIAEEFISCMPANEWMKWKYGQPRGGTPPIRVGDEYISFFHSHKLIFNKKIYFVGAYSFDTHAPFAIKRFTEKPLLKAMDPTYRTKHLKIGLGVVFPCGALYENNIWTISYGYNDEKIKIGSISHQELIKNMKTINRDTNHDKMRIATKIRELYSKAVVFIHKKIYDLLVDIETSF